MDRISIILSMGLGGAICMIILFLVWLFTAYLKTRTGHAPVKLPGTAQKERRQRQRADIILPVRMETSQGTIEAEIKNIGLSGAFIRCQKPLALRESFRLTIDAPNHDPLMVKAEVIWSNINVPDEMVLNRGMGIRFIRITKDAREFLNQVLSAQLENNVGRAYSL